MLRVNKLLGFRKVAGKAKFEKDLTRVSRAGA